jgi:type I restriction enzyme, S subunit
MPRGRPKNLASDAPPSGKAAKTERPKGNGGTSVSRRSCSSPPTSCESQVTKGDLVFTCWGTINQVGIIDGTSRYPKYVISNKQMKFTADTTKASPLYLYYWFSGPEGQAQIIAGGIGSSVPGFNLGQVRQMRVPLPPLDVQHAITSVLSALDDKINLNHGMNETLEAMARAIFKDWLVDFGPTRVKKEDGAPYLAPEIWALFPDRLNNESKPGWRSDQLQQIVELNPSEPIHKGTVAPYLDMAALPTSGSIPAQTISREFTSGMRFRNGDTLFARITPCLENGKTAFVQSLPGSVIGSGSTEFIVLRSRPPVPMPYTYLLARDPSFRAFAIQSMTGTSGRQRARNEALAAYPVTCPEAEVWVAFGSLIEPMFDRIKANGEGSHTLAATRDLLLPKLMSGEIRLTDAEKKVQAVV